MRKRKYQSSSSSSPILLVPKGGFPDLTLLKIINDLEYNQDIVCLLMTCKAYYREFMKQYAKVITFKGYELNHFDNDGVAKSIIGSNMKPFQGIYNSSMEILETQHCDDQYTESSLSLKEKSTKESILEAVQDPTKLTSLELEEYKGHIKDLRLLCFQATITPIFIPETVIDLTADVDNTDNAIFPSKLVKFTTTTSFNSPYTYPPTLRKLVYKRGDDPPPVIYLPTSLEKFSCPITRIDESSSVFVLPSTMVINNDNSPSVNNQPYLFPSRLKKLTITREYETYKDDFSIRIDQIINCSNVEHLVFHHSENHHGYFRLDLYIRRLDNGDVMINSGDLFFGGGLSNLTLLKIINDLEYNQDIVCLLMTCKAYYREFMKQYAKVITFKGIKGHASHHRSWSIDKFIISSQMKPFKEIYTSSSLETTTTKVPRTTVTITGSITRELIIKAVEDSTKLKNIDLYEFTGDIKDVLFPSIITMSIDIESVLPRFPTISQWSCCNLTQLSISSGVVLPADLQFPPSLTELHINYSCSDTFSIDLENLMFLNDLSIFSFSGATLIPVTNIHLPNPNNSLELTILYLSIPLNPTTMTQSFFPPNLQDLTMDFQFFGNTKPPPTVTKMDMETNKRIPKDFFPKGLLDLSLVLLGGSSLDPGVLPQGLKKLYMNDRCCKILPEYIPDTVVDLWVNVANSRKALFPSGLVKFKTSTNYNSPFNYPPTMREMSFRKSRHPPPIIYLPTSLDTLSCSISRINDTLVFVFPTTKVINNDNSSPTDNPPHFILPYRLKKIEVALDEVKDNYSFKNDFSFRIDQIINCSNV
ncbi:hypothetical protein DFA_09290 [Cavenderia fasciculata]|uniref:Uncharacterized protein n=1 Tax=Cavenderia fasciculata TaxID=261658 RepID=F4Q778_CACFS|nr:uncharacterized protein DFA_09290 [Cavenderia fasciculata]EGG16260.1 hypothetical protein DFA_09290 [Cavenderia fasciculata]|eukprot:XP_004354644.1 hypothetical protein DFA_09290 [Cavenderia fasciculata]